ncbi:hypothetical protein FB451DRAFT_1101988 [Mycena latifolia]|nr:hypothetical protein FB451DRAFT_1101988 [Mycena latifolia]
MKFSCTGILFPVLLTAQLVTSKVCQGSECVSLYSGSDCQGELTNYVPTCNSGCYQYSSFNSVGVSGNGILGTDCHIFSDSNCQNQITDTGNQVDGKCINTQGAQSMICYFDC